MQSAPSFAGCVFCFWWSDFIGAAAQGYDALAGTGGDISKLSTNEGAVRMAIDLALDTAKAFSPEQTAIPVLQGAADRYDAAVNSILGIDPDTVAKILPQILYATTVQGDIILRTVGFAFRFGKLQSQVNTPENSGKSESIVSWRAVRKPASSSVPSIVLKDFC